MIEQLYNAYYEELIRWCSSMTRDPVLSQDLVQEAFLRALTNAELLESLQEKQARAWLYRTVKNLYVDRVRHGAFETAVDTVPEQHQTMQELDEVDYGLLIAQLPEEEGMLFVMRYLEGYNSVELGRFLGLPPGTVRAKLSSARKHLRLALGNAGHRKVPGVQEGERYG